MFVPLLFDPEIKENMVSKIYSITQKDQGLPVNTGTIQIRRLLKSVRYLVKKIDKSSPYYFTLKV
jgi:hypothetical protein